MAESLTEEQPGDKNSVAPFKLGLIGVLSLVLVYVLMDANNGNQTPVSTGIDNRTSEQAVHDHPRARAASSPNKTIDWPEFRLEETLVHNPFSMANQKDGSEEEKKADRHLEQLFSNLRTQKVNLILESPEGSTAILGSRVIKKGDVVDGFRVLDIQPDGVIVEIAK